MEPVSFEYEVCLRCHGDNPSQPPAPIQRQNYDPNLRLEIDPAGPSFHPIAGLGRNADVPSLIAPWTTTSWVYCTDCHANDQAPGAGGTGPAGPHGSQWPYLLEREYRTSDFTTESLQSYALCYKCHSRTSILNDEGFSEHDKHVRGEDTPCSVCHDPHGVRAGGVGDQTHLIDFDTTVVSPDPSTGRLEFIDNGLRNGECYLLCHGTEHSPESY